MPGRCRLVSQTEISSDRLLEGNTSNGMSHSASLAGLDTWLVICPQSSRTVRPQPLVTFQRSIRCRKPLCSISIFISRVIFSPHPFTMSGDLCALLPKLFCCPPPSVFYTLLLFLHSTGISQPTPSSFEARTALALC